MRVALPIVLAVAVLAAPAARAEGAPDLAARQAAVTRLDQARAQVAGERARLQARLDTLAAEIARLKAHRAAAAPLFTDPELDRRLKAAQALSAQADALTRKQAGLDGALRAAAKALVAAYDAALSRARDALAKAAPAGTVAAAETVARLEADRQAAAAELARLAPAGAGRTTVPALGPASDDPQALEAQADLLRDTRDRLARRLATLKDRAADLGRQQALAGQMHGFLSETRLFDESDRTASRLTTTVQTMNAGNQTPTGGTATGSAGGGAQAGSPAPGGGTGTGTGGSIDGPNAPGTGTGTGDAPQPVRQLTRADASATPDSLGRLGDDASLDDVQARMKRLQTLIHRLDGKARVLDQKARALRPR